MGLVRWLKGKVSHRGRALSHYRLGIRYAKAHDHDRAIDEYTTVIDAMDPPHDVQAMALYNRALVFEATGDGSQATDDLRAVIAGGQSPNHIKTVARQRLLRMNRRQRR